MYILQLNPQVRVKTPLGWGWAFFLIDYGLDVNTVWVVRMDGALAYAGSGSVSEVGIFMPPMRGMPFGCVKHFDSNDVLIEGNPMVGFAFLEK